MTVTLQSKIVPRAQAELFAAQKTIEALNQSLAIRAAKVLDRWPRAKHALKNLGDRLTGS